MKKFIQSERAEGCSGIRREEGAGVTRNVGLEPSLSRREWCGYFFIGLGDGIFGLHEIVFLHCLS